MQLFRASFLFLLVVSNISCSASKTVETSGNAIAPLVSPSPLTMIDEWVRKEWIARYEQMKTDILMAQTKWNGNSLQTYSFVAAKSRGGVSSPWNRSPVRISVIDGKDSAIGLIDPSDKSNLARTDGFEDFDTINKLFAYMLQELERGYLVRFKYDKHLGYPTEVSIIEFLGPHGGRSIDITDFKS